MEIRPATEADLEAEYEVFQGAIGELYFRHGLDPPNPPLEVFVAYQGHLLRHDGERSLVAEADGRIVGFAAALVREDTWFLASLFVSPRHQARGVGRGLLDGVWGDGHLRRLTLTDSIQQVSNGLYARRGLIPVTPMLHLGGTVGPVATPALEESAPDPAALAVLDRTAYGFDRARDHAYWASLAQPTVWLRDTEPVAYSYAWEHGRIGPLAASNGPNAGEALRAELTRLRGTHAEVVVPGSSREAVAAGLGAGLRFTRPPGLLLVSEGVRPPRGLAISGYALF